MWVKRLWRRIRGRFPNGRRAPVQLPLTHHWEEVPFWKGSPITRYSRFRCILRYVTLVHILALAGLLSALVAGWDPYCEVALGVSCVEILKGLL